MMEDRLRAKTIREMGGAVYGRVVELIRKMTEEERQLLASNMDESMYWFVDQLMYSLAEHCVEGEICLSNDEDMPVIVPDHYHL
jgi:hypothetical protein